MWRTSTSTSSLRSGSAATFYQFDVAVEFAPITGPMARPECDVTRKADYCCNATFIYFTASPHGAEPTWERALELAGRHELGLFFVGSEAGEVYRPDGDGGLAVVSTRR